jgi:hypothetical protein
MEPPVLVLVRDLMFSGRIDATARTADVPVKILRDPALLEGEKAGTLLIVDLGQPGALEAAAAWRQRKGGEVVGFVAHVDEETIRRAREAGIDRVLTRGQFVQALPELLTAP